MNNQNMKKNTYIYLIRHSEQLRTQDNDFEDSQIANEKRILTKEGEKKAEEISKLEELKNIDVLWSSNYTRAILTAKYIADENNIEINIDKDLGERKLRRFRKFKRIRKNYATFFYNRTDIR